jgi:hypothetical protein
LILSAKTTVLKKKLKTLCTIASHLIEHNAI